MTRKPCFDCRGLFCPEFFGQRFCDDCANKDLSSDCGACQTPLVDHRDGVCPSVEVQDDLNR